MNALLYCETRPHKDLDIVAALGDLPMLWKLLNEHGFTLQYVVACQSHKLWHPTMDGFG